MKLFLHIHVNYIRKQHKNMNRILVTALIFCAALRIGAQSPLGLTYPLGVPDLAVSGASAALGSGGTAAIEQYMGASLNPANAAVGNRSVFSALISYDIVSVYDDGATDDISGYVPKYISLIVPIGQAGNLSFSMQKRYDANLNFQTTKEEVGATTTHTYITEIRRTGGLSSWQAGWAYRFGNGFGIGLIYERLFFNLETHNVSASVLTFGDDTYMTRISDSVVVAFASNGLRFGAQIPVNDKVTLGLTGEYLFPGNKNGSEIGGYYLDLDTADGDGYKKKLSVTLPPSMTIGAAYRPDDHWLFVADARTVLWDSYEKSYDDPDTKPETEFGISVGARYIPAANVLSSKYWEKINYGVGIRYATLPNNREDDRAHEYAFSAGAGLPIHRDGGMVDIVVSYSRRSDPKYSNYEENIVKLQLGLNGGRNWFQRDTSKDY